MQAVGWELKKARNLFTSILRDPRYDDASCIALVSGFISMFLFQVEPLLWRRGIFRVLETYEGEWPGELKGFSGFWLFPFEWVSPERAGLWIPAAVVYLVNAVLIDRFVAKHGGADASFRRSILILRRLVGGLPLLGLCVIPLWRILANRKPAWASWSAAPRLVLGGPDPAMRLPRGGAELHSVGFFVWLLLSNLLALRAAVAWLDEPERATATGLLAVQAICGSLRIVGLVCTVIYVRLRDREGALWGKRKWSLLLSAGSWVLPQSAFLLGILALVLVGERWGSVMKDVRAHSTRERDAEGPLFSALGRAFHNVALDEATLQALRLYREKTFLLMTEVASVMMLVVPARERYPWLNLPGCLVALLFLVSLLMLPVGAVLYLRSLLFLFSRHADRTKRWMEHPLARYLLLTAMAVVGGFSIGALAGAREVGTLGTLLFLIGTFGTTIGFPAALWGLVRMGEKLLIIWPVLFTMIGMTGYEMQHGSPRLLELGIGPTVEDVAKFHLFKLHLMIPLVLLLTVFAGLYRCRWLVRPFRVRDIFNPSLPKPLRRRLAFLTFTACMPLGGFFVPLWIRIRSTLAGYSLPEEAQAPRS
ncbi:MAG: hypothetical protein QOH06_2488 [Acidobacteriota bacterium]|jgi:uncharacterized membrane protein|nr:hypothetical protein [Acidobacteriota bacterium]